MKRFSADFSVVWQCVALIAGLAALSACGLFGGKETPHHPKAPLRIEADIFVQRLSLARLALTQGDTPSANKQAETIEAYTAQKKRDTARVPVAVLEYEINGQASNEQLIVPIRVPAEKPEFPYLLEVIKKLGKQPYTLHDVRLDTVLAIPKEPVKLDGLSAESLRQMLDKQHRLLMKTGKKPAPLDDTRTQLQLTRFFMARHLRDGAYLSMDNAKQSLATAARDMPADQPPLKELTQELEALETQLHETLPF